MTAQPGNLMAAKWLPAHDAALTKHLAANMSFADAAGEINREFGTAYSRNATIGRAGRIRLRSTVGKSQGSKRHKGPRKAQPRAPKIERKAPAVFACDPASGLRVADVIPRNIPLFELQPGDCRWPYGHGPFVFCGCPTLADGSYCEAHQALSARVSHQGAA
jgi:GcrA cell cycle regulator